MDFATLSQLIGALGFPIVACIAMYIRMEKADEMHKDEMTKITMSLNNNTLALQRLTDKLGGGTND